MGSNMAACCWTWPSIIGLLLFRFSPSSRKSVTRKASSSGTPMPAPTPAICPLEKPPPEPDDVALEEVVLSQVAVSTMGVKLAVILKVSAVSQSWLPQVHVEAPFEARVQSLIPAPSEGLSGGSRTVSKKKGVCRK